MTHHTIRAGRAAVALLLTGLVLAPAAACTTWSDTTRTPLWQAIDVTGTASPAADELPLPFHSLSATLEDLVHQTSGTVPPGRVRQARTDLAGLWTVTVTDAPHVDDVAAQFPAKAADPDGCDAQEAIVLAYATAPRWERGTCRVTAGTWWSRYDQKFATSVDELAVDHLVPLAEAWRSGAWQWQPELRAELAADAGGQLVPVTRAAHADKAGRDVTEWQPHMAERCRYAVDWIAVKKLYRMTVDLPERDALERMLHTCKNG